MKDDMQQVLQQRFEGASCIGIQDAIAIAEQSLLRGESLEKAVERMRDFYDFKRTKLVDAEVRAAIDESAGLHKEMVAATAAMLNVQQRTAHA